MLNVTTLALSNSEVSPAADTSTHTTVVAEKNPANESAGIGALGLNASSLIFQIINFIILYLILRKFLFKPLAKVIQDRQKTIEDSLKNAEDIEQQKSAWEEKQKILLNDAIKKSSQIIDEAKHTTKQQREESLKETKVQQEAIIKATKAEIELSRQKAMDDVKKDIAMLVVDVTRKVTKSVINPKENDAIVQKSIKDSL